MRSRGRPLSPHLTIYKPQMSSVLSIFHRMTGFFLFFAIIILSWSMIIVIMQSMGMVLSDHDFSCIFNSIFFKLFVLTSVLSLYYHLFNGIRHLFWDMSLGFEIKTMHRTGYMVMILSALFTIATVFFVMINKF